MSALSPSSRLLQLRLWRLCGQWRAMASEPSSLLGEDRSQRWGSLLRNLGSTPEGQLKALQLVDSQQVLEQKQFQALLDDVAGQLPRDVGEKTSWESTSQLADVLKKLNVQSLHQRLGARLNNALLQESDAKLEVLMEKFCGSVADDYALWILNRKLEGLLDSLNFDEVVTFLHLLGPGSARSIARVLPRLRAMLERPLSSSSWAKLMQIFDQEGSGLGAWEILDALVQQKIDVSNWKLPEAAVLGSTLGRHGLEKHSQLAGALLQNVVPQISQDSDVELNLLCISGAFSVHTPTDDMAQKALSGLSTLGSVTSARDALQILSLMLQLWRHWPQKLDLPKHWKDADFSPAVAELAALCASAGASFTGEAAAELGRAEHLAVLRPFLNRLDVKASEVASSLDSQDFSSVALSLARLGLGHEFLSNGDLESRLASSSFDASSLARLVWAMASLEASPVAWSLIQMHLRHLKGQELKEEDQALLYEALSSQAVFNPKAFEEQAWKSWEKIWSSKAYTPRSEHLSSLVPLLSELKGEDCEADAQIGQSPWRAPVLFAKKKIILDVLPTARHPASGKTRGDLMLKHHTWAETGHTVLVIPDAEWPSASSQGELLKWIKEKVDQLHKRMYLQHDGLDKKVQEVLLKVELGDRGINSQGLERLAGLPPRNQMDAVNKYRASLKDSVKNPTAWLIGIIKEQEKLLAKKEPATSSPEPSSDSTASTASTTAAVGRPKDGWQHEGRGLDQVRVGEQLMGKVTNIYRDRVWVDVGLVKDGSFLYKGDLDGLKVGQLFRNLKVSRVDLQRNWVELQAPKVPKERPVAASPTVPLAKKPAGGWGHKGGTLLAELQVGSSVTGKVTNVLRDRVWVDVGAESDATFKKSPEKTFKVGDVVSGEVSYIDLKTEKKIVRMQPHENT